MTSNGQYCNVLLIVGFFCVLLFTPPTMPQELIPQPLNCDKLITNREGLRGNFSSPMGTNGTYPGNVRCRFKFRAESGYVVRLYWYTFRLEDPINKLNDLPQCLKDYVEVIVIDYDDIQYVHGRYCGSKLPQNFATMQQAVDVVFQSSYTKHYPGFSGAYEFVSEESIGPPTSNYPKNSGIGSCGGSVTRVAAGTKPIRGGVIMNPGFPETYPPEIDCYWLIRVNPDKRIFIKLTELQLSTGIADCDNAYVSVIDGYAHYITQNPDNLPITQQQRFCGEKQYFKEEGQKTFMSERNRLIVRFKTTKKPVQEVLEKRKNEHTPIGFHLIWTEVPDPKESKMKPCTQFLCKGGEYCLDAGRSICVEKTKYCIDNSLVCDGIPNCAEFDNSDEEHCYSWEIIIVAVGVLIFLVLIITLVVCCQRRQRMRGRAARKESFQRRNQASSGVSTSNSIQYTPAFSRDEQLPNSTGARIKLSANQIEDNHRPAAASTPPPYHAVVPSSTSTTKLLSPGSGGGSPAKELQQPSCVRENTRENIRETRDNRETGNRSPGIPLRQLDESPSSRYKEVTLRNYDAANAKIQAHARSSGHQQPLQYRPASGSESDDQLLEAEHGPPLAANHVGPPKAKTPPPYAQAIIGRKGGGARTPPALGAVYVPDATVPQSPELSGNRNRPTASSRASPPLHQPVKRLMLEPSLTAQDVSGPQLPSLPVLANEGESAINVALRRRVIGGCGVAAIPHITVREASDPQLLHGTGAPVPPIRTEPIRGIVRPQPIRKTDSIEADYTEASVSRVASKTNPSQPTGDRWQRGRSPPQIELHEMPSSTSITAPVVTRPVNGGFTAPANSSSPWESRDLITGSSGSSQFPPPPPEFLKFNPVLRSPSSSVPQSEVIAQDISAGGTADSCSKPAGILKSAHVMHSSYPPPHATPITPYASPSSPCVRMPVVRYRAPTPAAPRGVNPRTAVVRPPPPPKPPVVPKGFANKHPPGATAVATVTVPTRSALKSASSSSQPSKLKTVEFREPPISPCSSTDEFPPDKQFPPSTCQTGPPKESPLENESADTSTCVPWQRAPRALIPPPLDLGSIPTGDNADNDKSPSPWHHRVKPTSV